MENHTKNPPKSGKFIIESHEKNPIPRWTFVVTPLSLLAMITTPWPEIASQSPESAPLILVLLSVGMALVCISMAHWLRAIFGVKS